MWGKWVPHQLRMANETQRQQQKSVEKSLCSGDEIDGKTTATTKINASDTKKIHYF